MKFFSTLFLTLTLMVGCESSLHAFKFPHIANIFRRNVPAIAQRAHIGIIKLDGKINNKLAEDFIKKTNEFSRKTYIDGILLIINSGGGSSGFSDLISLEIKALAAKKPIVVLVTNQCCSGAYQTAVSANWIIAPASAAVGSIGVVTTIEKHTNAKMNEAGYSADVTYDIIHAGKYKVINYFGTAPLTEEERAWIQEQVNADYKIFYTIVAQQRNLALEKLTEWADGQIFNGEQALALGMIDQVGGYSDAVNALTDILQKQNKKTYDNLVFYE